MKLERINKDKIKCTLSKKDLDTRNISVNELTYGSSKARRLFQDMLNQANIQFGFDAKNSPLLIEAIPISEETIVLNISRVEEPDELDTRFSRFSQVLSGSEEEEEMDLSSYSMNSIADKLFAIDDTEPDSEKKTPKSHDYTAYFLFEELKDVITAAKIINPYYKGDNNLKRTEKGYLLSLKKGSIPNEAFGSICNILSDCGIQEEPDRGTQYHYNRNTRLIIAEQAIESLANL